MLSSAKNSVPTREQFLQPYFIEKPQIEGFVFVHTRAVTSLPYSYAMNTPQNDTYGSKPPGDTMEHDPGPLPTTWQTDLQDGLAKYVWH